MNNNKQTSLLQIIFNSNLLLTVLYPLDRMYSVRQIQSTYMSSSIRQEKYIPTKCMHNGVRAMYRGLPAWVFKQTTLLSLINWFQNRKSKQENQRVDKYLQLGTLSLLYTVLYPLQILRIRMCANVQNSKIYLSLNHCFNRTKSHQGYNIFYQGYGLGLLQFGIQINIVHQLFKLLKQHSPYHNESRIYQFITAIVASQAIVYPLDTIKKIYQINGALGHTNNNPTLRCIVSRNISSLYSGFSIRLLMSGIYTTFFFSLLNQTME